MFENYIKFGVFENIEINPFCFLCRGSPEIMFNEAELGCEEHIEEGV